MAILWISLSQGWKMKKIWIICVLSLFGGFLSADSLKPISDDVFKLLKIYQDRGISAVQKEFDEYLLSPEYWLKILEGRDVRYGYYESAKFVFVSNKLAPDLKLLKITKKGFEELGNSSALVAKGKGHKKLEGDLTTPIGVYDLTARLTGLPPYYGPLALATNYPNVYDKSLKKTGGGIWIHGLPLDGNREELNTRGCIAIDNELLKKYDKLINYRDTIVIISEGEPQMLSLQSVAQLLSGLYRWREMWQNNDLQKYLSFYDSKDFIRENGMTYKAFVEHKTRVFAKNEEKNIGISAIDISPFINESGRQMFRINFRQDYRAMLNGKVTYNSSHRKDLFVWLDNGKMKILSEK